VLRTCRVVHSFVERSNILVEIQREGPYGANLPTEIGPFLFFFPPNHPFGSTRQRFALSRGFCPWSSRQTTGTKAQRAQHKRNNPSRKATEGNPPQRDWFFYPAPALFFFWRLGCFFTRRLGCAKIVKLYGPGVMMGLFAQQQ
jgi:hypothetical protein